MKLREAKKKSNQNPLPGPSNEMMSAKSNLEKTKERAAGRDKEGMQLRGTIKEHHPFRVIKRHFKGE